MNLLTLKRAALTLLAAFSCGLALAAQVEIVAPEQKSVVHNNAGDMIVAVKVEPPLEQGRVLRILLDGKPAAPAAAQLQFALAGVERGEHFVQALLIDDQGRTLAVSDTVFFTMWQASIRNPARRPN